MASPSPGGDWRHPPAGGGGSPAPAGHRPPASRRSWQPGDPGGQPPAKKKRSRAFRLGVAAAAAGLLVGLVVVVVQWWQRAHYPELAAVGPDSPATGLLSLPENAVGKNTAEAFDAWAKEGRESGRPRPHSGAIVTVEATGPKVEIPPNPKSLVVYLAAVGGADKDGPFLWVSPATATGAADARKLYVRDILDRVKTTRNDREKPTLLIFDSTGAAPSWAHGGGFNDFAEALKDMDGAIKDIEGLAVICASDKDQRSWAFEERKTTVFGHFFLEALRGAGHDPGGLVTALSAFDYAKVKVKDWVIANRIEQQTPVLLPAEFGPTRAKAVDLAAAPADGYKGAPTPESPGAIPAELEQAWVVAEKIAGQTPPPEANNPGLWREYLDLLLRWERTFRLGADTTAIRARVEGLAGELGNPFGGRESPALSAALPAGRALGRKPLFANDKEFKAFQAEFVKQVWDAKTPTERTAAWAKFRAAHPGQEKAVAVADAVLNHLIDAGPDPRNLGIADDVLKITHLETELPVEAHFVRTLRHLLNPEAGAAPDADRLKQALRLRRDAEAAAWVFRTGPTQYAYPEYVRLWVSKHITDGDRSRQLGQDLLFSVNPADWAKAGEKFVEAEKAYTLARDDGQKVAAALTTRDRVFARLPYYARWLANYPAPPRGTLPGTQVDRLLQHVETAARKAHEIAALTTQAEPPLNRLGDLVRLRGEADKEFEAVTTVFEQQLHPLGADANPSTWHRTDVALTVPFIPHTRRVELLRNLRSVSHQLVVNQQQQPGAEVSTPQELENRTRETAARHARAALAFLSLSEETDQRRQQLLNLRQHLDQPDRNAWRNSYRKLGDEIGGLFRGLADEAKALTDKAGVAPSLKEVGPHLTAAAFKTRLADPAARVLVRTDPKQPAFDPVTTDLQFRQHGLLLWHAGRATAEGWAFVGSTSEEGTRTADTDKWYCRQVVGALVRSADPLVRATAKNLTGLDLNAADTTVQKRWLADCERETSRKPVVLALAPPGAREVADEPSWPYSFWVSVAPADRDAVGYPVSMVDAPAKPYLQVARTELARRVVREFEDKKPRADRDVQFKTTGKPETASDPARITAAVLYRGHLYQSATDVVPVGRPIREVIIRPAVGPAAFGIRADPKDITGAVVILVDLTKSMNKSILTGKDNESPSRIEEARLGVKEILGNLKGATVTLAYFYGKGRETVAQPVDKPLFLDDANRWGGLFGKFAAMPATGESTPLAGAIREVLNPKRAKEFWPETFTGSRTLIVLTDGADNFQKVYGDPGEVALKALREAQKNANPGDDMNLHLVFFGLGATKEARDEEAEAAAQFKILEDKTRFRDPDGVPAKLWTGVGNAKGLAAIASRAVLPRFLFYSEKKRQYRLEATMGRTVVATTPLEEGIYQFWDLRSQQGIRVWPGDRVMAQTRRNSPTEKFDLSLFPFAYEVAGDPDSPRPRNKTDGIHGTIPALKINPGSQRAGISLTTTLEPIWNPTPQHLEAPRAKFVWFDPAYADGKPPDKGSTPGLRIENRIAMDDRVTNRQWKALWAPAWDLTLSDWCSSVVSAEDKIRHPVVTAYWLDRFPVTAASFNVKLNELRTPGTQVKSGETARFRDSAATIRGISLEEYEEPGLEKGWYLTVRVKYAKPGEFVFARPGNLKGADQPFQLHERHFYYDEHSLYTARFGPLRDTELNKEATVELYSVADLRAESKAANQSVELRPIEGRLRQDIMPQPLEVLPRKE